MGLPFIIDHLFLQRHILIALLKQNPSNVTKV